MKALADEGKAKIGRIGRRRHRQRPRRQGQHVVAVSDGSCRPLQRQVDLVQRRRPRRSAARAAAAGRTWPRAAVRTAPDRGGARRHRRGDRRRLRAVGVAGEDRRRWAGRRPGYAATAACLPLRSACRQTTMPRMVEESWVKELLIVLATAGVVVPLFGRLRFGVVPGFLIAGVVLGPGGLGKLTGDVPWLGYVTFSDPERVRAFRRSRRPVAAVPDRARVLARPAVADAPRRCSGWGRGRCILSAAIIVGERCGCPDHGRWRWSSAWRWRCRRRRSSRRR